MKAKTEISELLAEVVRKHHDEVGYLATSSNDQHWNGKWWMPLEGCDTLENMLDDMVYALERAQEQNEKKGKNTKTKKMPPL